MSTRSPSRVSARLRTSGCLVTILSSAASKRYVANIPVSVLVRTFSFVQKVIEVDTREAQRVGLLRPLVRREIEKHFADFGLEPEFVSHNTMRGLSGGQKVKIVLGAATWRRPHIMCLDEPTSTHPIYQLFCQLPVTLHLLARLPRSRITCCSYRSTEGLRWRCSGHHPQS